MHIIVQYFIISLFIIISCLFDLSGGKLVEPTPEIQKEMAAELDRVTKTFGFKAGANVKDLPPMKFEGKIS